MRPKAYWADRDTEAKAEYRERVKAHQLKMEKQRVDRLSRGR